MGPRSEVTDLGPSRAASHMLSDAPCLVPSRGSGAGPAGPEEGVRPAVSCRFSNLLATRGILAGPQEHKVPANRHNALVAQWIEHRFPKPGVAGSIPAGGTTCFLLRAISCGALERTQLPNRQNCRQTADETHDDRMVRLSTRRHESPRAAVTARGRSAPAPDSMRFPRLPRLKVALSSRRHRSPGRRRHPSPGWCS